MLLLIEDFLYFTTIEVKNQELAMIAVKNQGSALRVCQNYGMLYIEYTVV